MASGEPCSNGVAAKLWRSCRSDADRSLFHPFVQSLGRGELSRDLFANYIAQDSWYLEAFARSYAFAIVEADGLPGNAKQTLSDLREGVLEEAKLHADYAQQLNIPPEALKKPNAATSEYTAFLLKVAQEKDVARILAAMIPCSRLYAYLGCQLAEQFSGHSHQFSAWIKTYSAPDYLTLPARKEELLDLLADNSAFGELLALYKTAMQLEVDFFEAHSPEERFE